MEAADDLLRRAVDEDGNVDYAEALSGAGLDDALAVIARADRSDMSPDEDYAFLINAYNVCVLDGVRRRVPPGSGRSLTNPFWWVVFFLFTWFTIAGRRMNLVRLEFAWIRPHLKRDPRGHFALVCAGVGCPPLRGGVYRTDHLDEDLEAAARAFHRPGGGYRVDRERGRLLLSTIYRWYAGEFGGKAGVIENWKRYADPDDVAWFEERPARISYLKYDWSLNEASHER